MPFHLTFDLPIWCTSFDAYVTLHLRGWCKTDQFLVLCNILQVGRMTDGLDSFLRRCIVLAVRYTYVDLGIYALYLNADDNIGGELEGIIYPMEDAARLCTYSLG